MVKGHRERSGEDAACALLTLRALMEGAGEKDIGKHLEKLGLRLNNSESKVNKVGERANGVEEIPIGMCFQENGAKRVWCKSAHCK